MYIGTIIITLVLSIIIFRGLYLIKYKKILLPESNCIIEKLLLPFTSLRKLWNPNDILIIDFIKKNSLIINTQKKEIFILEIFDSKSINEAFFINLFKTHSTNTNGAFFQTILKNKTKQQHFILSYSLDLINDIQKETDSELKTGQESNTILNNLIFITPYEINKLSKNNLEDKKQNIVSNYEIYQGYKAKEGAVKDIYNKLLKTNIQCTVWSYYDFYEGRVDGYISKKLYNYDIDKEHQDLILTNHILISKDITKNELNEISDIYNLSLVKKSIDNKDILLKTPLKYRDVDWDLLVNLDYLSNQYISKKESL